MFSCLFSSSDIILSYLERTHQTFFFCYSKVFNRKRKSWNKNIELCNDSKVGWELD
jgi:hypothetical protein